MFTAENCPIKQKSAVQMSLSLLDVIGNRIAMVSLLLVRWLAC